MKTIELSTSLIGISGMFCTYHGWGRPEEVFPDADLIEEDFNNGDTDIHPDYAYLHWDNKAYMKEWNEAALSSTEDLLNEVFDHFELVGVSFVGGDYYSPREYNFGGDQSNFDLEIPDNFLSMVLASVDRESLEGFLKEKYSSRSGFISFTPNNLEDLLNEIDDEPSRCWGALISFLVSEYMDYEDCREEIINKFVEELASDNSYTSFVDTTELDEFQEEVYPIIDCEWKKALFTRDFLSQRDYRRDIMSDYGKGESAEEITKRVHESIGDDVWVEPSVIEKFVRSIFKEIESNTLTLYL